MSDLPGQDAPKPETLKLFPKKYPPAVLVLGVIALALALLFLVTKIWSATQPPNLQYRYEEPAKEKRR